MSDLSGKVAVVTGAGQGQGRAHCLRLAADGASVIAIDSCAPDPTVTHALATPEDLSQTVAAVRERGGEIRAFEADVADYPALAAAIEAGAEDLGGVDIVICNAGIFSSGKAWELSEEVWKRMIDVQLTGAWHAAKACIPRMIAAERGGSIVVTGSTAATKGLPNMAHYVAAKHGMVGLMRALAVELAPYEIRVNVVSPTSVNTGLLHNDEIYLLFTGGERMPSRDEFASMNQESHLLPIPWIEPEEVADAAAFLVSEQGRHITGVVLPVDGGFTAR